MRSVIIDTDMAGDDWMAILYLLKHPDVQVKAITVTGTGECRCAPGVHNALGLLELANYAAIPVTCGSETPLRGTQEFPQKWRDAVDNLYGLTLPAHNRQPAPQSAVDLLVALVEASPDPVAILALGPLTNLAEFFQARPDLISKIESVVIMGGAVFVPGNVNVASHPCDNDHAEWNIFVDPYAADVVLQSGAPVVLVSLDSTDHAPVTEAFYQRVKQNAVTTEARFLQQILEQQHKAISNATYFFWDPFAAVVLTNPEITTLETHRLRVVRETGNEIGRTAVDTSGAPIQVTIGADKDAFERIYFEVVNTLT